MGFSLAAAWRLAASDEFIVEERCQGLEGHLSGRPCDGFGHGAGLQLLQ